MKYTILTGALQLVAVCAIATGSHKLRPADFKREMVESHDFYRQQHDVKPLAWNNHLAQEAHSWADTCNFYHEATGENLAYKTKPKCWGDFTNMWGTERKLYNFDYPGYSKATAHFTQLVWKNTTEFGCAWTECQGGGSNKAEGTYVVCRYGPPGNQIHHFGQNVNRQVSGSPNDEY